MRKIGKRRRNRNKCRKISKCERNRGVNAEREEEKQKREIENRLTKVRGVQIRMNITEEIDE